MGSQHPEINFGIENRSSNIRSSSHKRESGNKKGEGLINDSLQKSNTIRFDMSFKTNDADGNQDTVIIEKNKKDKSSKNSESSKKKKKAYSNSSHVLTFDEHMWDNIPEIQHHTK